jgi:7-cyano-7-deazaguanine synthase
MRARKAGLILPVSSQLGRIVMPNMGGYCSGKWGLEAAFEAMANLATKAGVEGAQRLKIHAPLMHWHKARIIREGLALGVDYALTSSCYDPADDGRPCGECDACLLRAKGFAEAGLVDPLLTRHGMA